MYDEFTCLLIGSVIIASNGEFQNYEKSSDMPQNLAVNEENPIAKIDR